MMLAFVVVLMRPDMIRTINRTYQMLNLNSCYIKPCTNWITLLTMVKYSELFTCLMMTTKVFADTVSRL